jgi:hypothetical protein
MALASAERWVGEVILGSRNFSRISENVRFRTGRCGLLTALALRIWKVANLQVRQGYFWRRDHARGPFSAMAASGPFRSVLQFARNQILKRQPMSQPPKVLLCVLAPLREAPFPLPLCETSCRVAPPAPTRNAARVYNRDFKGKLPEIGCCHTRQGMVCPGASRSLLYFQPLGMVG